jgi:hypothetical protein
MDLTDAYVAEVGRRLPEKQRADIEREIRSMIEDTLDDESRTQGRPVDEDLLVTVLKRLGPPEKLAASYAPPPYLVGPGLYPSYLLSLRLALGIVLALGAVGVVAASALGARFGTNANAVYEALRGMGLGALNLVNVAIQVVGVVTIIFALIQRAIPELKPQGLPVQFDPRKLKIEPAPQAEPFKPAGLVVEMVLALLALVLFNFYPQFVGGYIFDGSQWHMYPVLTTVFFAYVPFLSILWALEVALKGSVLAAGRWTPALRWGALALKVLGVGMLYVLLTGPEIVAVPAEAILNPGSPAFPGQFNQIVNAGLRMGLGIGLVVATVEVVVKTIRMLFGKKGALSLVF